MKKAKKWRYYCDYCKKSGGSSGAMATHEKYCTMNQDRQCRMCDIVDGATRTKEYVQFIKDNLRKIHNNNEYSDDIINDIDSEHFSRLKEMADHCPACILSALRQSGIYYNDFDYKNEISSMWQIHNDE